MRRLRFGLIGTGYISAKYVSVFRKVKNAELVAVFSRNKERGIWFSKKYSLKEFSDFNFFLNEVDAVVITTENNTHADFGIKAGERGKHILIEKPVDTDLKKVKTLIRIGKKKNVKLSVVSQYRFGRLIKSLKEKMISKVKSIELVYFNPRPDTYYKDSWKGSREKAGGGIVINLLVHFLDVMIWVFGVPKVVSAKISSRHGLEVEDTAIIDLEFPKNIKAKIRATTNTKVKRVYLKIRTKKRVIRISDNILSNFIYNPLSFAWNPGTIKLQVEDFIQAIKKNRDPLVTGEEGLRVLKVIDEIYKKSRVF